jgi:hypothetical protein
MILVICFIDKARIEFGPEGQIRSSNGEVYCFFKKFINLSQLLSSVSVANCANDPIRLEFGRL